MGKTVFLCAVLALFAETASAQESDGLPLPKPPTVKIWNHPFEWVKQEVASVEKRFADWEAQKAREEAAALARNPADDHAAVIGRSPTLTKEIAELEKGGWKIHYGRPYAGSWCSHSTKEIVVDQAAESPVAVLAHEIGHALHAYPDAPFDPSMTLEEFAKGQSEIDADGEGAAVLNNARVRAEILQAGGPDIGLNGKHSKEYAAIAASPQLSDEVKAKRIGALIGDEAHEFEGQETYADAWKRTAPADYARALARWKAAHAPKHETPGFVGKLP